ncbi:hypothetical protein H5410_058224 [Solanum commersonii]|uniref:NB-ARC domain-containing protein n=1 Tax=Solanum commersonii TaxID=4109 RepID=A0A9J5WR30_SOLCO|nr:hypothetical protein H5410_058224 [Solanum commersonii]
MAYTEVTSLLQTLQRLKQLHPKSGKKIESLLQKVSLLQGFFDDTGKDHEDIKCLEGIIRDVSCKAEDLVEEIMFEYSSSSSLKKNAIKFLGVNRVLFRKIKSIEAAITSVYNDISSIKGRSTPSSSVNGCSRDVTQTLSSQKDVVVGLDDDFLRIADKLTGYPEKLDVVVIFGMGGIGKTTLAKRIFHDKLIEEHFYVRAWITVSERYKVRNMLLDLLGCTSKVPFIMDEMENEKLAELLYKSLKGQRYLIVMDDVWYTEAWDDVRRYFPNDKNGSRVMVTSRIMKVARFISPFNPPHQMRFLTVDESWKLLQKKILGLDDPSFCCDYEMERIGMQISKRCKGLPLAIVMVAGILSKESATASKWSDVAENIHSSFVTEESREFLDILALSYNHLPHHLKACFLYMGAFPEDVEIPVWRLIRLWTAEGFIKLESPKTLEFVAQEYLQELIDRSLIIVSKRSYDNRVKTCSIHDILRNFCQEEAKQEKLLHVVRRLEPHFPQGVHRRLHFHSDIFAYSSYTYSNPYVRSFLSSKACSVLEDSYFGCMGFKLLRVLDVVNYSFYGFPIHVIKLVHLRYLALSINSELPRSISKLKNLQTLIIYWGTKEMRILPLEIWKMPILRHIHVKGDVLLFGSSIADHSKRNFQVLGNLQTLCTITISTINFSHGLVATLPNLKTLASNLVTGGNHDAFDVDWLGSCLNNLEQMYSLETLKLLFNLPMNSPRPRNSIQRWNAFPPNLKNLTLSCSFLLWEDARVLGNLPNLEVLKLKDFSFQGPEWETDEEGFHRLKYLLVESRDLVVWKQASTDSYPFPVLQHLVLRFCYKLKEIPYEIGDIPSLQVIELHSCSPYATRLARMIQQEQIDSGNSCLEVFIHPAR